MKSLAIFLLSVFFPIFLFAGEYGFLRVTVLEGNLSHSTLVGLKINGKLVASFSHATTTAVLVEVEGSTLAAGTSTPLSSDYTSLQKGCVFSFRIDFSMDKASWISLGTFEAPTNLVNVSLPLGLCDGSLCSVDSTIQKKLREIENKKWKQQAEAVRQWLEQAIKNEQREMEALKQSVEAERAEAAVTPLPAIEVDLDKMVHDMRSELDQPVAIETPKPDTSLDFDAALVRAIDNGSINKVIEQNAREQNFLQMCSNSDATTQYICSKYGGMGWIGAAAEAIAISLASNPNQAASDLEQRILDPTVRASLGTAIEKRTEMRLRIEKVIEAKRSEAMWAEIKTASRVGIAFSPVNDVVDFCEAMTGKMMCLPSGEALTRPERFMAVLGMIAGNRMMWEGLAEEAKIALLGDRAAVESMEASGKLIDKIGASKFAEVLEMPKGLRPSPESYLPKKYIEAHLAKFDDGASFLIPKDYLDKYGRQSIGFPDNTQFAMPKKEVDEIIERTGGALGLIEKELGLPAGSWQGKEISRIDSPKPREYGLRLPSGNEAGANEQWFPGGRVPGGQSEAVLNNIPWGSYVERGIDL